MNVKFATLAIIPKFRLIHNFPKDAKRDEISDI